MRAHGAAENLVELGDLVANRELSQDLLLDVKIERQVGGDKKDHVDGARNQFEAGAQLEGEMPRASSKPRKSRKR